jgi:hypothetical protein
MEDINTGGSGHRALMSLINPSMFRPFKKRSIITGLDTTTYDGLVESERGLPQAAAVGFVSRAAG